MKKLLLRTWITNIGNGFIDKGALEIIKKATNSSNITEVSGYPDGIWNYRQNLEDDRSYDVEYRESNSVNIAQYIDTDVAFVPGCILYSHVLERFKSILLHLSNKNIPIIMLGVGGGNYDKNTVDYVKKVVSSLNIKGIITRDKVAYESYKNLSCQVYSGIDCAFFINDWYNPPRSNTDFDVLNFDKIDIPGSLNLNKRYIYTNHNPFMYKINDLSKVINTNENENSNANKSILEKVKNGILRRMRKTKDDKHDKYRKMEFVSDSLKDYLFLYANTGITHSDRIHACIPTLAYGNKAKFWFDTDREKLFEHTTGLGIKKDETKLEVNKIKKMKRDQVEKLKSILKLI